MYWENQPELPSDKGRNWSRGATRDIRSPPLMQSSAKPTLINLGKYFYEAFALRKSLVN